MHRIQVRYFHEYGASTSSRASAGTVCNSPDVGAAAVCVGHLYANLDPLLPAITNVWG